MILSVKIAITAKQMLQIAILGTCANICSKTWLQLLLSVVAEGIAVLIMDQEYNHCILLPSMHALR